ncbi:MAG: AraC family transcriptional regulator [Winogradskyella sp.]
MQPELEHIAIEASQQSFHFFKRSDTVFLPYWHYHPELELTLIKKGDGTRFVGDSIASFSDYDLVLVGKNLPHHWVSASKIENQEAYIFQFRSSLFRGFTECDAFYTLFEKAKRGLHFFNPSETLIEQIIAFEQLSKISKLSTLIEIIEQLSLDNNFNILASENYLERLQLAGSQAKIAKATNYILEHLDEQLSVNRMAEFTHMVPQSFCRWFKKHSGHSFVSFLNQTRIERVCLLLTTTNTPIQDIAFSCGFESLSHFNRTFKKMKNCSPSEFRKNQK